MAGLRMRREELLRTRCDQTLSSGNFVHGQCTYRNAFPTLPLRNLPIKLFDLVASPEAMLMALRVKLIDSVTLPDRVRPATGMD